MTRTMYDSTTVADIPAHATIVAGYIDGRYRTIPALGRRFPHATVVTITVLGESGAHVIDCEPGDTTPAQAAAWAAREVAAGRTPTIYCMQSQWISVKLAVAKQKITGKVNYWIASYDNHPVLPPGAVAKQYADPTTSGGHYDVSVVADYWPGVDPVPARTSQQRRLATAQRLIRRAIRLLAKGNK